MGEGKIYTEIRQKNKIRQKIEKTKNKLLYLLFRLGFGRGGLGIGGFVLSWLAGATLAGMVGR